MEIIFVDGPKDGERIEEQWVSGETALCERFHAGAWWWGAVVIHGSGCFLYREEHSRDVADLSPPNTLRLTLGGEARESDVDMFRVYRRGRFKVYA